MSKKFKFHYNLTIITGTSHEDLRTFMITVFGRSEQKRFSLFVDFQRKFLVSLRFRFSFRSIIASCGLLFAFRHLIADLTLTHAVYFKSTHYLILLYYSSPCIKNDL
jgi:hypothetical protein